MNKYLKMVLVVLLFVGGSTSGYLTYSQYRSLTNKINQLTTDLKNKDEEIKDLNTQNSTYKETIDSLRAEVELYKTREKASEEERNSPYFGWKTYTDNGLGIKFKYPANFSIKRQGDGLAVYTTLSDVLENNPYEMRKVEIITFTTTNPIAGWETPTKPSDEEPQSLKINGKTLELKKTSFMEGVGNLAGGSFMYSTKIGSELYASIWKTTLHTTKFKCEELTYPYEAYESFATKEDCDNFNYLILETKFETSKQDVDKAVLLLQSIEFI